MGKHLTAHRQLRFTHIYASDLQRAYMTAEELQRNQVAQWAHQHRVPEVVRLELLREQDFGSLELVPWASKRAQQAFDNAVPGQADPDFRPKEDLGSMATRAEAFLDNFIFPLFATSTDDLLNPTNPPTQDCVAVVSHGMFLSTLWQSLLRKFPAGSVSLGPNVEVGRYPQPLERLPSWSNTAFLELTIQRPASITPTNDSIPGPAFDEPGCPPALSGHHMMVHVANSREHLVGLNRARGGLGSSPFDPRQRSLLGFFNNPEGNKLGR
ncbi:hypothetical protein A1O3_10349 [Capronia epimyces CBS 606.96]|uniref:2,3-bisphosphoglycerate-dependent phosphoglycerate mutase n=1 Tax=Capronia epimyces CBS 606.96 TaxID=1182542 RepID=W9XJN9_9EURO|nr:uncharacterized protein A1O3_10349 [Capronia epimyces CBS 606.96]EXJ77191.1 hypothetical protein A1O3_10349 [Capronia epimyces CBS 606.96]